MRVFSQASNAILAGNDSVLDLTITENELQLKRQVEDNTSHRRAKIEDILARWEDG